MDRLLTLNTNHLARGTGRIGRREGMAGAQDERNGTQGR